MSEALTQVQKFPDDVVQILRKPIPNEALSAAPRGMTSIKSIYISERLNEAFGVGGWRLTDKLVDKVESRLREDGKEIPATVVVKATMRLRDYPWFQACAYGGNNNADLGDAYKGAVSDALSKIAAVHLNVALEVYKGLATPGQPQVERSSVKEQLRASVEDPLFDENGDMIEAPQGKPAPSPNPKGDVQPIKKTEPSMVKDPISEKQVKRFIAICISNQKSKPEIAEALSKHRLVRIEDCSWRGKAYEELCAWAAS